MPRAMAEVHANGLAVAVIDAGQVVYVRAFGQRNGEAEALRDDTVMVGIVLYLVVALALVSVCVNCTIRASNVPRM